MNEEQRRKDEADRAAIVAHLRDQSRQGDKSLAGNDGYRKFLKTTPTKRFEVDEAKVEREARYDGKWVLRTNLEADAESVAHAYKQLWMVEAMFRTAKSVLDTRPIYHKRDETIRGHVFCSYLALVLKCELERRMRDKDMEFEWAEVMRGIDELQEVEAKFQGRRFLMRSKLVRQAQKAITAAGVPLPPTLREPD